jgi:hypothetical protein
MEYADEYADQKVYDHTKQQTAKRNTTMEKHARITRTTFKNVWAGPNGNVYYHDIELDNGDKGSIGSKEQMPAKLNPGQELTYTITDGKIKAAAPAPGGGGFGGGFKGKAPVDPRAQFIGFSSAYAKDLVVAGKLELKDMNGASESIFKNMLKLYEPIK